MEPTRSATGGASVHVENVGGIVETDVALEPGVNVLAGRNATNRTSFLRALMAALGSDEVAIRGDAEEGSVELTVGGETYTRHLHRGDGVVATGDPYLDDSTAADLFAFLLEANEARRAVATGGDLHEVLMRPLDTGAIEEEIDRLEEEKREIDRELEERRGLEEELEDLRAERDRLDSEIESTREELADTRAEIQAADADLADAREERGELDEKLAELQDRRGERETVRHRIESKRETVERLREEREAVEERLEAAGVGTEVDEAELEVRVETLRGRKRDLEATVNKLQGIVQFNREMLEGDGTIDLQSVVADGDARSAPVTEELLGDDESLVCWTCGTETEREEVEGTLEALRERHREVVARRRSVAEELEEAVDRQRAAREAAERRAELESERRRLEEQIEEGEGAIGRLGDRLGELDDEVEALEAAVEALREEDLAAVVDLHSRANELEFEVERLSNERDRVASRVESTEERIEERSALEERREAVSEDLDAARTRIDRLEAEAVESFNDHAAEVLSILGYDNVERIWLERKAADGRGSGSRFELHVVRTTDDGTAYEDAVAHLSESEREVTGLVFGLAGYLVHELYEEVPFVVLDSLEAIDAERIAALVEYFAEFAPYLVVALLPGDAEAVEADNRVESI